MNDRKILLVDDEEIILNSFQADLSRHGFEITTANSGEAALALLSENIYDLVVTDLVMGGIGGIEVLEKVKKKNPFISVIILTGYGDMKSAVEALRLGADDYLLKPCDVDELLLRMDRCLQKQDAVRKIDIYEKVLPICCVCSQIRDDTGVGHGEGEWMSMDAFVKKRTTVALSHTYCPICYEKAVAE